MVHEDGSLSLQPVTHLGMVESRAVVCYFVDYAVNFGIDGHERGRHECDAVMICLTVPFN